MKNIVSPNSGLIEGSPEIMREIRIANQGPTVHLLVIKLGIENLNYLSYVANYISVYIHTSIIR